MVLDGVHKKLIIRIMDCCLVFEGALIWLMFGLLLFQGSRCCLYKGDSILDCQERLRKIPTY